MKGAYLHYEKDGDQFFVWTVYSLSCLLIEFSVSPCYFGLAET